MLRKSLLFLAMLGISAGVVAADMETILRVFTLEHASVSEVSAAVQPLLSEEGSMTLRPKLSRIIVQDQPEVIDRVTALIEELDHLPGSYSVRFDLLESGEPKPYGTSDQVKVEDRLQKMFNAAAFYRLGRSTIEGVSGSPAVAELGSSFQVSFLAQVAEPTASSPWGAREPGTRLHLRQLVLERKQVAADGTVVTDELLRTNVQLSSKQTVYIGAGNSEDSEAVLVLIVRAEEFGSP
jgi:hypothetical protein